MAQKTPNAPAGRETLLLKDEKMTHYQPAQGHHSSNSHIGQNNFPISTRQFADIIPGLGGKEQHSPDPNSSDFKSTFVTLEPRLVRNLDSMENFSIPSPEKMAKFKHLAKDRRLSKE